MNVYVHEVPVMTKSLTICMPLLNENMEVLSRLLVVLISGSTEQISIKFGIKADQH
jgi:hypothetical protein